MIEDGGLKFVNLNGMQWIFNTDTCPLKEFDPEADLAGEEVERMQEPGIWPYRTKTSKLLIHATGDILRDTSADFITDMITMKNILIPAGVVETERRMGTVWLRYVGQPWYYGDCTFDGYPQLPFRALYPSVAEFSITFKVFAGYMINSATGAPVTI